MTIRANKFTPEILLGAPRRSEGNPNSDASKVLYSLSTYSFEEHAKTSEIRVLDVKSGETSLITDDKGASEPQWLDDATVLLLNEGDKGTTVKIGPADGFSERYVCSRTYPKRGHGQRTAAHPMEAFWDNTGRNCAFAGLTIKQ
jgi:dipeptidyl aminopeptidase/acylaminoacyl peptidase